MPTPPWPNPVHERALDEPDEDVPEGTLGEIGEASAGKEVCVGVVWLEPEPPEPEAVSPPEAVFVGRFFSDCFI